MDLCTLNNVGTAYFLKAEAVRKEHGDDKTAVLNEDSALFYHSKALETKYEFEKAQIIREQFESTHGPGVARIQNTGRATMC